MDKYLNDLIELLTEGDGSYNDEIGAYVTAYALGEDELRVELEYIDRDSDEEEVIEVKTFTVKFGMN